MQTIAELVASLKADRTRFQETLDRMRSGALETREAIGTGAWRVTTAESIAMYEGLIANLDAVIERAGG
jgi:hypothetical protein